MVGDHGVRLKRSFARWRPDLARYARQHGAYDAVAVSFVLLAFAVARASVHDLSWPCESDLYRDLGTAQSILDGTAGQDPAYAGERWWYPPLVPALVAAFSVVTGTPLHVAYTTAGLTLNLLAPAGFYVMLVALAGRAPALLGLSGFLFLGQLDLPSWMHATYSPWLWSCNLAQAFFYLAIAAVVGAVRTGDGWRAALAGLLLGLTSLAHAAPALLLGGVVAVTALRELTRAVSRPRLHSLGVTLGLMVAVTVLVSWPFWSDILFHYRLRVKNTVPLTWLAGELALERVGELAGRLVSVRGVFALAGVGGLLVPRLRLAPGARAAFLAWGGLALAGLGYGYASQRMTLPPLFPSWHFYFYLQGFESAAFGLGFAWVCSLLSSLLRRLIPRARASSWSSRDAFSALGLLVLAAWTATRLEAYDKRLDLTHHRAMSFAYAKHPVIRVYQWARDEAGPGTVLAPSTTGFFAAAANRRVVVLQDLFSSPYVRHSERAADADVMLRELRGGRPERWPGLARAYGVRYAVLEASERDHYRKIEGLRRVSAGKDRKNGFDVYELRAPWR